jgi:hypothetical protein
MQICEGQNSKTGKSPNSMANSMPKCFTDFAKQNSCVLCAVRHFQFHSSSFIYSSILNDISTHPFISFSQSTFFVFSFFEPQSKIHLKLPPPSPLRWLPLLMADVPLMRANRHPISRHSHPFSTTFIHSPPIHSFPSPRGNGEGGPAADLGDFGARLKSDGYLIRLGTRPSPAAAPSAAASPTFETIRRGFIWRKKGRSPPKRSRCSFMAAKQKTATTTAEASSGRATGLVRMFS